MKSVFFSLSVAAAMLAAAPNAWALPPRQHSISGVIENFNITSHALTLNPGKGSKPVAFVWNAGTRFTSHDGCARCSLVSGQTVRVTYRREVGRNVLREVRVLGESNPCGVGCN
jgi:hypothetical protein